MNPKNNAKLKKVQEMFARGFDIGSMPLAPFLYDEQDDKQGVIDRVQDGLATLENGQVIPEKEIYNPDGINLEGSYYDHGQVFSMDQAKEDIKKKLEGIIERQRARQVGEGTVLREPPSSGIIDSVVGDNAVLETGELIPIDSINNPDSLNLEGARYEGGKVFSMDEQREKMRQKLEGIKSRQK